MDDEVLTKEELAKLLKTTVRTVDRLRTEGMPFFRIGNMVRFNKAKVLAWLEEQEKV
jgi:excisionase family DNA binding protein